MRAWRKTGEVRTPAVGEWFLGILDRPVLATINFKNNKFPIIVFEDEPEQDGLRRGMEQQFGEEFRRLKE